MSEKKKPDIKAQPSLIGHKIYLRPATADDVANTYHWFLLSDPHAQSCHIHPMLTPSEAAENFKKREKSTDRQQLMIIDIKEQKTVGRVTFHNFNSLNRSAELGLIIDPDERKKGYGVEAIKLISGYLFNYRGLNKVHAQTASFNRGAMKLLTKAGFKLDGTLRQHYFYEGEFYDGLIYSLLRFEYEE